MPVDSTDDGREEALVRLRLARIGTGRQLCSVASRLAPGELKQTHEERPRFPSRAVKPISLHFTSRCLASVASSSATCLSRSASLISVGIPAAARTRPFTTESSDDMVQC